MSDFPRGAEQRGISNQAIAVGSLLSLGSALHCASPQITTSVAWPSANRALFVPFRLPNFATVKKILVGCGSTAGGSFDVGIYDRFGNRLVSSGATARVATSEVNVDITDTTLGPGLYFMAMAANGIDTYVGGVPAQIGMCQAVGMRQMDTAYVLPNPATFASVTAAFIPAINLRLTAV